MFHSARIKLTAWYLLIIMTISLAFSGFIYARTCRDFERSFRRIEIRRRAEELGIPLPRFFPPESENLPLRLREIPFKYVLAEDLQEAKKRLLLNLLLINGVILSFSTFAGYFLAGKTLKPIENAMEEQKRFIADASHELRTPLTALKTSLEVALRDKKMSLTEAKKILKDNLEEVDSLKSLTDKLLSLTRYQSDGKNLAFKEVSIKEIVERSIRKISPLAKEKKIEIEIIINNPNLVADEESLEEMFLIFLDNAIKYTPEGGKVTIQGESSKKNFVIKIKDTGIGIAKKDLPHIFDRFYQADQSRSKKIDGFGLGLALAKKIIEIHKGTIEVDSVLGKGTVFTIRLPLKH